jgi:hypothetical protein
MVQTKQHRGGYLLTDVCTSEESIAQTNLIEKSRNRKFVFSTFRLSRETFPPSQIFIRPTTGKYIQRSSWKIITLSLIGREHWDPPEGMRRNGRSRIFPAYNPDSLDRKVDASSGITKIYGSSHGIHLRPWPSF